MSNGGRSSLLDIIIGILCIVLALPIFILVHQQIPNPDWPYHADRILLMISIILLLFLVIRLFRVLILVAILAACGWLIYGSLNGGYSFNDVYYDYRAMIYGMKDDPNFAGLITNGGSSFPYRGEFVSAMDEKSPAVRQFAVSAINEHFKAEQQEFEEYRSIIQSFAIFKKINTHWNYVDDPQSREYFASASESVKLMAGDCDDHSILMAAAIESVGGKPRLIHTTGHIYPELLIGNKNDLEQLNYLIKQKLFVDESRGQSINYHQDDKGNIWLNLDYTAKYPGGPFMKEEILNVMTW